MKRVALMLAVIFGAVYGYAQEYKIVLLSYTKFEEAQKGLNALEPKLDESFHQLQSQYRYEIVARPSGRAFLIGIEPIEGRENADRIREKFSSLYPKSYIDKYYGPTEGSVFMAHAAEPVAPAAPVEVNETASAEGDSASTSPAPQEVTHEAEKLPVAAAEESTGGWGWIATVLVAAVAFFLYLRRDKERAEPTAVAAEEHLAAAGKDPVPEEETLCEPTVQAALVVETAPETDLRPIEEGEEERGAEALPTAEEEGDVGLQKDNFDKLKSNMFFMLLVNELKAAAQNRELEQCRDIIAEMQRYEKNGPKSTVVQSMSELVEMKKFTRLLAFIEAKMNEGEES